MKRNAANTRQRQRSMYASVRMSTDPRGRMRKAKPRRSVAGQRLKAMTLRSAQAAASIISTPTAPAPPIRAEMAECVTCGTLSPEAGTSIR